MQQLQWSTDPGSIKVSLVHQSQGILPMTPHKLPVPTREQLLAHSPNFDSLPIRQQRRVTKLVQYQLAGINQPRSQEEILASISPEDRNKTVYVL